MSSSKSKLKENTNKQLNLFAMSKEALIKKVQILMHELSIYHRLQAQGGSRNHNDLETVQKQLVEKDIIIQQLQKNQNILQATLELKLKEIQGSSCAQRQQEKAISNLSKENQILKKQIITIERFKNKQKSQRIDSLSKDFQAKINNLESENKLLKKLVSELTNKTKILNQLNQQTQQKLANALVSNKTSKTEKLQNEKSLADKQNLQTVNQGNLKLQNLALRQQIRELRDKIRALQQSKQALRVKFQQRQLLYSRMLPLK